MKKTILTILLTTSLFAYSQEKKFGATAGANFHILTDGILKEFGEFGTSFNFGVFYQTKLTENISFYPKLVYSVQGDSDVKSNISFANATDASDFNYVLSYLNVPLNFKFYSKPYIIAGPQIGILLNTDKKGLDFGDVDSSIDFGVNLGIGYDINDFFIECSFYHGLTNIYEFNSSDVNVRNAVLQLNIGYRFL